MPTTPPNVLFKRGPQSRLPSTTAAVVDGAFYLTTDTNRLYVGTEEHELRLLNQTVQIVNAIANLPVFASGTEAAHVNDFYYCTNENVLCVWKENVNNNPYGWQQINKNTDHVNDTIEVDVSAASNVATVTHSIVDDKGHSVSGTFAIQATNGITATVNASDQIVLSGDQYSLSRSVDNNQATVVLSSTNQASTTSGFVIRGGENVTISTTGTNGIAIDVTDDALESATLSLGSNGEIELELNNKFSPTVTATLSNIGLILDDQSFVALGDTSAKTAGSVYSKAQVDRLLQGLDGMTYKGTIAKQGKTSTVHTLPTTEVRNGDTYVVTSEGMTATDVGGTIIETGSELTNGTRIGDMFIASGAENASTGYITNVQWTYIPSGNDSAAEFTYTSAVTTATNTLDMTNGAGATVMAVTVQASTGINVVSDTNAGANQLITTISHATYSTSSTTSTATSTSAFSAISSLTLENGHVVSINTETFNPVVYELADGRSSTTTVDSDVVNGTRVDSNTNSGANDLTVATTLGNAEGAIINSSILKFSSSSLKLSKGNDGEVVMNMEWGTF